MAMSPWNTLFLSIMIALAAIVIGISLVSMITDLYAELTYWRDRKKGKGKENA